MKDIKLIGLDMDGTALNTHKQLTPRVAGAIVRAIAAGVVVLPATGRALHGIPKAMLELPGMRYALTSNGAMVYDLQEDQILLSNCFTRPEALEILAVCEALKLKAAAVFIGGTAYSETLDVDDLRGMYPEEALVHLRTTREKVPSLRVLIEAASEPVEKYSLVFRDMATRRRAVAMLRARGICAMTSSMPHNLELNTPTANKGAALLALGQLLGIAQAQVMAVGDSPNDLDMMRAVGWPVAMANSAPEVLAAAASVTASNNEDGVALAIEAVLE